MLEFESSRLVSNMRGLKYKNRKFESVVLPRLASKVQTPMVFGHVKRVLEEQGFETDPSTDNRSCYDPDQSFVALSRYIPKPFKEIDKTAFAIAVRRARRAFGKPITGQPLRVMSIEEVAEIVKLDHSSGAPQYASKREALPNDIARAKRIVAGQRKPDPATAFFRIQTGVKQRLVWGYGAPMTLVEGMIAHPINRMFLRMRTPMAYGMMKMAVSSRTLPIRNCKFAIGLDFSKFDSSIKPYLIRAVFDILRTWYDESAKHIFDIVEDFFINTSIVMPDGYVYWKHTGVPSGSWFTQLVDSVANYIAIQYAMICLTQRPLPDHHILVLGDDSLIGVDYPIRVSDLSHHFESLGLTLNVLKTSVSEGQQRIHFLGHEWEGGLPHRDPSDLAMRMIYPERADFTQRVSALQRIAEYISDAVEAWAILWHAFQQTYHSAPEQPIFAAGSVLERKPNHGYFRFVQREFGSPESYGTWAYMCSSVLH